MENGTLHCLLKQINCMGILSMLKRHYVHLISNKADVCSSLLIQRVSHVNVGRWREKVDGVDIDQILNLHEGTLRLANFMVQR